MQPYLVFRLYGPLASWGEIAVGESRHSAAYPSKSALIGLLAAALGIPRTEEARQASLASGYRFGVKLLAGGMPMRDYHTVQAPPQQKKVVYRTRRQELMDEERLGTLLSAREYRCDSLSVVAVQMLPQAPFLLEELAAALEKPRFQLFLGRKSCPLAAPLLARVADFETLKAALDSFDGLPLIPNRSSFFEYSRPAPRYYWEANDEPGMAVSMTLTRHDQPASRRRWQFSPRKELLFIGEEQS